MTARAALIAAALAASGCSSAVKHPAITAGVVASTLGFTTCRLAASDTLACAAVGGGAGAFLGLVAAAALWLGGDGDTVLVEDQARPLPDDGRPIEPAPETDPAVPPATSPVPLSPSPASPPGSPASPPGSPASPPGSPASPPGSPASPPG